MTLVRWDPWREMEELVERYNRELGAGKEESSQDVMRKGDWSPRVDIAETDDQFIIKAEIPEVKKEDVKVTVENGVLLLHGERKQEKEEKGKTYHRIERHYGVFNRSFTLPETVSQKGIEASFKDGVLTITLKKQEKAKPKTIEVTIND
ncbi:MAG: Hsp20/alpha crystallin family protein [Desulfuromonadaceae bacterium]|nr:Hsp20/alpha crystallin family protein [Desulfuromonadaceae bacterium]